MNTKSISRDLRKSVEEAGEAVRTISHETTDTILTNTEIADFLAEYAMVIAQIIKISVNLFSSNVKGVTYKFLKHCKIVRNHPAFQERI